MTGSDASRPLPATLALTALLAAALVLYMFAGRHLTFFYDEWGFILRRRGGGVTSLLEPHNGHIVLFQVIVYKLLFALVGLRHYWPYQLINILLHLLCVALLYVLLRRRLGPWTALAPASLLLFMGSAWQDLLWPFQIGWFASVAGGLGALALIERPSRRSDLGAAALLVGSLSGSAVGVAFLLACAALLLVMPDARGRLWVVIGPGALFALWYLGYGTSEQITSDAVLGSPHYVTQAAAGAAAGLAGLDPSWGPPLAVAALALIVFALQNRRTGTPGWMAIAAAVGVLAFWVLTSIARAENGEPQASRYLYVGGVFILLAAGEARLGLGLRRLWAVGAVVLLLGAVLANIDILRAGERGLRSLDDTVRASLGIVQIAAPVVSPAFIAEPVDLPGVAAGPYLMAIRSLGSPALTPGELKRAPESIREHSDAVLARAENLRAIPASSAVTGSVRPAIDILYGGRSAVHNGCVVIAPSAPLASLDLSLMPGQRISVRSASSSVTVYLRRLASSFTSPAFATVPRAATRQVQIPMDTQRRLDWHIQLVASRRFIACTS